MDKTNSAYSEALLLLCRRAQTQTNFRKMSAAGEDVIKRESILGESVEVRSQPTGPGRREG